jgi:hypothetical protein
MTVVLIPGMFDKNDVIGSMFDDSYADFWHI